MPRFWPFGRKNQSQIPPPVTQFNQPARRRWRVVTVSVIAALVIVGLAVLAGVLIYNAVNNNGSKKSNVATNNQGQVPQAPPAGSAKPDKQGTAGDGHSSTKGGGGTQSGQVGKTLPNNGPGDVAVIALGAGFVAAGLHYVINLRRAKS